MTTVQHLQVSRLQVANQALSVTDANGSTVSTQTAGRRPDASFNGRDFASISERQRSPSERDDVHGN